MNVALLQGNNIVVRRGEERAYYGVDFEVDLEDAMVRAISWHLDDAFLTGDGVGKPQGAVTSANPARVVVTKESSQTADTLKGANVLKMWKRLHPALWKDAVWVANVNVLSELMGAHIAGTNADVFLFSPSRGEGAPDTLMGRPIFFSEKVPVLGDEADISLCAFSQYAIGIRKEMSIDRSIHSGFTKDTTVFRGLIRVDGQSLWNAPFTPKQSGADTLSWAVVLASRA